MTGKTTGEGPSQDPGAVEMDAPGTMTADTPLDRILAQASARLTDAGIEPAVARAEGEDLLAWALRRNGDPDADTSQIRLWALLGDGLAVHEDPHVAAAALGAFNTAIARRTRREPLQWIEGSAPFRGLDLLVGPGVFVPRPETELVAGAGIDALRPEMGSAQKPVIADLFAGSGAIGLACAAELPGLGVVAVEKSTTAYTYLRRNAEVLAVAHPAIRDRYVPLQADVFDATPLIARAACALGSPDGLLDAVITNPPYLPLDRPVTQPEAAADPDAALYGGSGDGLAIPLATIRLLPAILRPGGLVVMEHDPTQQKALEVKLGKEGFTAVAGGKDLSGRPRWVTARLAGATTPRRNTHQREDRS